MLLYLMLGFSINDDHALPTNSKQSYENWLVEDHSHDELEKSKHEYEKWEMEEQGKSTLLKGFIKQI